MYYPKKMPEHLILRVPLRTRVNVRATFQPSRIYSWQEMFATRKGFVYTSLVFPPPISQASRPVIYKANFSQGILAEKCIRFLDRFIFDISSKLKGLGTTYIYDV